MWTQSLEECLQLLGHIEKRGSNSWTWGILMFFFYPIEEHSRLVIDWYDVNNWADIRRENNYQRDSFSFQVKMKIYVLIVRHKTIHYQKSIKIRMQLRNRLNRLCIIFLVFNYSPGTYWTKENIATFIIIIIIIITSSSSSSQCCHCCYRCCSST